MRISLWISAICLLLASSLLAEELGLHRIPVKAKYGKAFVEPGSYQIHLENRENNAFVLLKQNDRVVAEDLAIMIPAMTSLKTKPQVQIVNNDEQHLLRIRVRSGDFWYYAYMKTKW